MLCGQVRLLQRLVLSGRSLPLLFPDEDLGFRYSAGALVESPGLGLGRGKEGGRGGELLSDVLAVGQRIPHCWLGTDGPAGSQKVSVLSTVHLPVFVDRLFGSICPVLLIVRTDNDSLSACLSECVAKWNRTLNFLAFVAVIVRPTESTFPHETVQTDCQQPRYAVGPSPLAPDSLLGPTDASPFQLAINIDNESLTDIRMSDNCVRLRDLTGRWGEVLGQVGGDAVVAVRPDGHVGAICTHDTNFDPFLAAISTAFHIKKKESTL